MFPSAEKHGALTSSSSESVAWCHSLEEHGQHSITDHRQGSTAEHKKVSNPLPRRNAAPPGCFKEEKKSHARTTPWPQSIPTTFSKGGGHLPHPTLHYALAGSHPTRPHFSQEYREAHGSSAVCEGCFTLVARA